MIRLNINITGKTIRAILNLLSLILWSIKVLENKLLKILGTGNAGELSVKLPKSKRAFKFFLSGELHNQVFLHGTLGYESETLPVWCSLVNMADLVLDIGAHVGYYSIIAHDENPEIEIHAFEPHPGNYAMLCTNLGKFNSEKYMHTYNLAISQDKGNEKLLLLGSGSTLAPDFWQDSEKIESFEVPAISLDQWVLENSIQITERSLIKMDVETFEPEILLGAKYVLSKNPAILCEVLATFTEDKLNKLLPPEEWKYFWLGPNGPAERRRIVGDPSWEYKNYLFIANSSPFLKIVNTI